MLKITPIEAFADNYFWIIRPESSQKACVVDPGDATEVLQYLRKNDLELVAIFITHHHADHTGGLDQLLKKFDIPVYGPKSRKIKQISYPLSQGDSFTLFEQTFHVHEIPCHTLDHIAFYTLEAACESAPVLFCGDTLFAGGCGRLFEGPAHMMYNSLAKLSALSDDTLVYCAHEYTLSNLDFAKSINPSNQNLSQRYQHEQEKRKKDLPTLPTTIALELATNPFLRCFDIEISQHAETYANKVLGNPEEVFEVIRLWKDSY